MQVPLTETMQTRRAIQIPIRTLLVERIYTQRKVLDNNQQKKNVTCQQIKFL